MVDPKTKIKEMLGEIIPQGWHVPSEITDFLLDGMSDAHKALQALERLTPRYSLTDTRTSANALADRIARERHSLERLHAEIANPTVTDSGEVIGRKMMTAAGLEKLLPVLEAEAERLKRDVQSAEEIGRKRGILRDLITLIRDLKAGAPVSPKYGDEVYELLPWALQEKGAAARAEAEAKQIQERAAAEVNAAIEAERRNEGWIKAEIAEAEAKERYEQELQAIATLDANAVIEKLFSLPHEREAVRQLFNGAWHSQAGTDTLRRLEGIQRDYPDQKRGLLLSRLRALDAQRRNATVMAR